MTWPETDQRPRVRKRAWMALNAYRRGELTTARFLAERVLAQHRAQGLKWLCCDWATFAAEALGWTPITHLTVMDSYTGRRVEPEQMQDTPRGRSSVWAARLVVAVSHRDYGMVEALLKSLNYPESEALLKAGAVVDLVAGVIGDREREVELQKMIMDSYK